MDRKDFRNSQCVSPKRKSRTSCANRQASRDQFESTINSSWEAGLRVGIERAMGVGIELVIERAFEKVHYRSLMQRIGQKKAWPGVAPVEERGFDIGYDIGIERGIEIGTVRERVDRILRTLSLRGIDLPPRDTANITHCFDLPSLEKWFDRAVTMGPDEEFFADSRA